MTISDAIKKLRVMLNAEEVVTEVKMAEAVLIDGTVVYTEGELAVGAVLYVAVAEGEAPFAPMGLHETTEGLMISVGENGVIEAIEEKAAEETPAVEVEVEVPTASEEMLSAIVDIIKPYQEEIKSLKNELSTLTERFNSVAGEPGAEPVKRNFSADAKATKAVEEARIERLVSLRKQLQK